MNDFDYEFSGNYNYTKADFDVNLTDLEKRIWLPITTHQPNPQPPITPLQSTFNGNYFPGFHSPIVDTNALPQNPYAFREPPPKLEVPINKTVEYYQTLPPQVLRKAHVDYLNVLEFKKKLNNLETLKEHGDTFKPERPRPKHANENAIKRQQSVLYYANNLEAAMQKPKRKQETFDNQTNANKENIDATQWRNLTNNFIDNTLLPTQLCNQTNDYVNNTLLPTQLRQTNAWQQNQSARNKKDETIINNFYVFNIINEKKEDKADLNLSLTDVSEICNVTAENTTEAISSGLASVSVSSGYVSGSDVSRDEPAVNITSPAHLKRMEELRKIMCTSTPIKDAKKAGSCNFCMKNGELAQIYESHAMKNENGDITCPILRKYVCEICGATGSRSHTRKYCPLNTEVRPVLPAFRLLANGSYCQSHYHK